MDRYLIMLGGGEIRAKETLPIDRKIAQLAKAHAGENRPCALFIGTASHDFMPYYNSFHKTYTGELGLKTDIVMTVYKQTEEEKMADKFAKADVIYIGGGDTVFMIEHWQQSGLLDKIMQAYNRGVPVCGLSAGAICWAQEMYTDSSKNGDEKYRLEHGLGLIKGGACPHYDLRKTDFAQAIDGTYPWVCIQNNSAVVYKNEQLVGSINAAGRSYIVTSSNGEIAEQEIEEVEEL